jgi:hypothetical protein
MQVINHKVYLYKPDGTSFLGELIVDNLKVDIKLQDISTIAFRIPEVINAQVNPRIDEVLDSYIIELWYGKVDGIYANGDFEKIRFRIYSTPLDFSDYQYLHSYSGYSLQSDLEFKQIVSWPGVQVKDFFRTITYNNNASTPLFTETGFTYSILTSSNTSSTKYFTFNTTDEPKALDIFIYEIRTNSATNTESKVALIELSSGGVNSNNFKAGYYHLNKTGDIINSVSIALPDNYTLFNGEATATFSYKFYDNPVARAFAVGIKTNTESPLNNMYIDLAQDAANGEPAVYEGYTFTTQSIYSKNGLKLNDILTGLDTASDGILYNTGFTVGTISNTIAAKYRSNIDFNNITVHQAIKDVAESFEAIPVFDSINKTVSFYAENEYGSNNGLMIKYATYLKSINKEIDASKIITNGRGLGKDNIKISLVNPTGSEVWEDYSYFLDDYHIEDTAGFTIVANETTGLAITYASTAGFQSRWMDAAEALKVAKWQYTRDYFHTVLSSSSATTVDASHNQYKDLYNLRSAAINLYVKNEEQYEKKKADEYKYYYLVEHYRDLYENKGTNLTEYNYYRNEYNTRIAQTAAYKSTDIDPIYNNIYGVDIPGTIAYKFAQVQSFLDKTTNPGWNINLDKLRTFQREAVHNDSKIDTEYDLLDSTKIYVDENKEPRITFNIGIIDVLEAQEAYQDWDKFVIGDKINIYFPEFNIDLEAQIREISIDFQGKNLSIVISTVRNYNRSFGSYLTKNIRRFHNANLNTVLFYKDGTDASIQDTNIFRDTFENGINGGNTTVSTGAVDGITGESSTTTSGEGQQSRVVTGVDLYTESLLLSAFNQGIKVTDGRILTFRPFNVEGVQWLQEVEVSAENGFVIRRVYANDVVTKLAYIDASNGSAFFAGWKLEPGQFSGGNETSFVGINSEDPEEDGTDNKSYAFWAGNETASNAPFSVTKDGDIKATSGSISGLTIGTGTYIDESGEEPVSVSKNAIYAGTGIWGADLTPFYLDEDGRFSLSNELKWDPNSNTFFVNGTIEATIGEIGGWTVAAEKLHAGSNTTYVELNADAASSYAIFAGDPTAASAPFSVTKSGALVATNATITGAITATSGSFTGSITSETGNIGGWAIGENSLSSGDITLSSVEDAAQISIGENIVLNNDGSATIGVLEIGLDGSVSTETFEIDDEGNATFSGALQAATGSFGAVTIDNDGSLTLGNITIDNSGINATVSEGDPAVEVVKFNLDSTTGLLTAVDADITGAITSSSGTIGGWEIEANTLTGGNIILDSTTDQEKISIGTNIELNTDGSAVLGSIEIGSDGSISSTDGSFVIDEDGAAAFAGTLTAASGSFGAVTIDAAGSITIGNITIDNTDGIVAKDEADDIKFSLNPTTGLLTATDADITGSITAEEGTIAGWEIAETTLSKNNVSLDSTGTITVGEGNDVAIISAVDASEQNNRIWVGDSDSELAPFKVDMEGNLTSTAGLIGGWTITEDSLSKTFDTESTNPVNIYAGTMPEAITVLSGGTYGFAIENTNPNDKQPFVTAMTNNGFYIFSKASYEGETAIPVMEIQYDDALIWANGLVISDDKNILNSNVVIGKFDPEILDDNDEPIGVGYGLVINNGDLETGSKIKLDYEGISIVKRVEGQSPLTTFSVDTSGNVSVKGDLTASTGTFGTVATDKGNVLLGGSDPLIVRNNETNILRLTNAGVLTVAGFTASSSAFYSGNKSTLASNEAGVYIATDGIALGTNSPFKVTSAGALTTTSATIGGWTVDSDSIFTGTKTDTENYASTAGHITIGSDGHISSKEFRIDADGSAHFGGALDAGVIDDIATSLDLETIISELQTQIDGSIDTWFYNDVPTLENLPASEWTTNEVKDQHRGDIYYDNDSGYAYRFTYVPSTSTYEWQLISDSAVVAALNTAQSKVTIFSVASDAYYGSNVDAKIQNGDYIIPTATITLTAAGRTSILANLAVTKNDLYLYDASTKTFSKSQNIENKDSGKVAGWEIDSANIKAKNSTMVLHSNSNVDGEQPYLSISQATPGYNEVGIFLGRVLDTSTYYPRLSLVNSDATNYLKWTGLELQVKGNVDATSGTIGGFTIANDRIKAGTLTGVNVGIGPNMATGVSFYAGAAITSPATEPTNDQINAAPFRVTNTGALTATSADITGAIKASSGEIGSGATNKWIIGTDSTNASIYNGKTTLSDSTNAGVYIGTDGISLGTASVAPEFSVTSAGVLNATSATIEGTITATDGRIGSTADGWDINANVLESKNDYIKLDAANNKILVGNITLQGALAEGDSYIGLGKTGYTLSETAGIYAGLDNGVAKLSIGNTTNSLTWDGEDLSVTGQITATSGAIAGFTIEDTVLTAGSLSAGASGSNVGLTPDSGDSNISIWAGASIATGTVPTDAEIVLAPFTVSKTGALKATDATIEGTITAEDGEIGGWTIDTNLISAGNITLDSTSGSEQININDKIVLNADGSATIGVLDIDINGTVSTSTGSFEIDGATGDATFAGEITAESGEIGGFTIGATTLTAGVTGEAIGISPSTGTNISFYAGAVVTSPALLPTTAEIDAAPFTVSKTGALKATGATIEGSITATSGEIAKWNINEELLTRDNVGIAANNDTYDYAFWAGSSNPGTSLPVFGVTHDGALTATDATITGAINAESGTIGSYTIDEYSINKNLISKASFESASADYNGWVLSGTWARSAVKSYAGNHSVSRVMNTTTSSLITYTFTKPKTSDVTLRFAYQFANVSSGSVSFYVQKNDGFPTSIILGNSVPVNTWNIFTVTIPHSGTNINTIRIGTSSSTTPTTPTLFIDEIELFDGSSASTDFINLSSAGLYLPNVSLDKYGIIANAGKIGGFTIGETTLTAGGSGQAVGISPSTGTNVSFYAGAAVTSPALIPNTTQINNAPFRVLNDGTTTVRFINFDTQAVVTAGVADTSSLFNGFGSFRYARVLARDVNGVPTNTLRVQMGTFTGIIGSPGLVGFTSFANGRAVAIGVQDNLTSTTGELYVSGSDGSVKIKDKELDFYDEAGAGTVAENTFTQIFARSKGTIGVFQSSNSNNNKIQFRIGRYTSNVAGDGIVGITFAPAFPIGLTYGVIAQGVTTTTNLAGTKFTYSVRDILRSGFTFINDSPDSAQSGFTWIAFAY